MRGSLPWWAAVGGVVLFLPAASRPPPASAKTRSRAALTKSIEMTIGLQAVGSILLFVAALFAH